MEEWREVPGSDGFYEVSNLGRFRSYAVQCSKRRPRATEPKIVRPYPDPAGYLLVSIRGNTGRRFVKRLHRVVLLAFVGEPQNGQEARHLDGDKGNNALGNLAWGTHRENAEDNRRNGTMARGERAGGAKITESDVREIRRLRADGLRLREIGERFGICEASVSLIASRKHWQHVV